MAADVRAAQPIAALLLPHFGLTAEALARGVGLDDRAVQRVLSGEYLPTPEFAARIARYLSAHEDSLFLPARREGKFHARACRACGATFSPSGPRNLVCRADARRRER